jgi:DNA-binding MarR family transcriptional regulator
VHLPCSLIQDNQICISAASLKVLTVLMYTFKGQNRFTHTPTAKVGQIRLIERTGYSRRQVSTAIKSLQQDGYINPVADRKGRRLNGSGVATYGLLKPDTGTSLSVDKPGNVLPNNDIPYFTVPECIVKESHHPWSLANLTGSGTTLYFAALYLANRNRSNRFKVTPQALRKLADLSHPTLTKAVSELQAKGLLSIEDDRELTVTLCDPHTGEPLFTPDGVNQNDPANYKVANDKGVERRLNLNHGAAEAERQIRLCLAEDEPVIEHGDGELKIRCPFHEHDRTPSLSVSPKKRCFHCFACKKKGTVTDLIAALMNISRAEAIQHMAQLNGDDAVFREPDKDAVKYDYRDENGKLKKQVLRFPNDEAGNKVIQQRRPVPGGWRYDVKGLPPMLFNQHCLTHNREVYLVEGEKDAATLTVHWEKGRLKGIATTSGGADSWSPSLALKLGAKRVTLMPDADDAGARYAADVIRSLEQEGIEHRLVSFADVGCKDVTDFLQRHPVENLIARIDTAWGREEPAADNAAVSDI